MSFLDELFFLVMFAFAVYYVGSIVYNRFFSSAIKRKRKNDELI